MSLVREGNRIRVQLPDIRLRINDLLHLDVVDVPLLAVALHLILDFRNIPLVYVVHKELTLLSPASNQRLLLLIKNRDNQTS